MGKQRRFRIWKLPIHTQILVAMILGALFGLAFPVNRQVVIVKTPVEEAEIAAWQEAEIWMPAQDSVLFRTSNRSELIRFFRKLSFEQRQQIVLRFRVPTDGQREYHPVVALKVPSSIAADLKPIGTLFLNLLKMIAIPLVLGTLIVGAASLGDLRKVARIGTKTIGFYLVTTAVAITIGLVVANVMEPGKTLSPELSRQLREAFREDVVAKVQQKADFNVLDFFVNVVPTNPFEAIASGDMLNIVFFAVFFGLVLTALPKEKAQPMIHFFDSLGAAMIKMVEVVMLIAPFGVFALIAAVVASFGFDILQTLIWYVLAVVLGLLLHAVVFYPLLLKTLARFPVRKFFKEVERAQLLAFSTSSSAATLPVSMRVAEQLGIPSSIYSFVLPLGATINMDGTALYQGIAAVFIAQVYGIPLDLSAQLTIVFIATMASIGTAPVPGVGIIMLIIVLQSVGIPEEGIALILGVDRILDMLRTTLNVTGDLTASVVIAASEKGLTKAA